MRSSSTSTSTWGEPSRAALSYNKNGGANGERYAKSSVPTQKLLIEGLHWEVSEEELTALFGEIGPVKKSFLRYDRSGRPSGSAVVIYETVSDARKAKAEYDGANAKGQPISITFEAMRGSAAGVHSDQGRMNGTPTGPKGDLRKRMDLAARLGGERPEPPADAPRGPSAGYSPYRRPDQARSVSSGRGKSGSRPAAGGAGRGVVRGAGAEGREGRRSNKTMTDLDAELEAFMKAPPEKSAGTEAETVNGKAAKDADVEMD